MPENTSSKRIHEGTALQGATTSIFSRVGLQRARNTALGLTFLFVIIMFLTALFESLSLKPWARPAQNERIDDTTTLASSNAANKTQSLTRAERLTIATIAGNGTRVSRERERVMIWVTPVGDSRRAISTGVFPFPFSDLFLYPSLGSFYGIHSFWHRYMLVGAKRFAKLIQRGLRVDDPFFQTNQCSSKDCRSIEPGHTEHRTTRYHVWRIFDNTVNSRLHDWFSPKSLYKVVNATFYGILYLTPGLVIWLGLVSNSLQ